MLALLRGTSERRARAKQTAWSRQEELLRRRLRLVVGVFTGLLWLDNVTEHYRGGFQQRLMWVPVLVNPVVAVAGVAAAVSPRPSWRRALLSLSALQALVAAVGVARHHVGIRNRVGNGPRMYLYNSWYGPPLLAPLQYLGFSVLGLLATLPRHALAPLLDVLSLPRVLRLYTAVSTPPLWVEIAQFHARGTFQDPFQWAPVVALPAAGAAAAFGGVKDSERGSNAHTAAAGTMLALGLAGTVFHLVGLGRRHGGYGRKSVAFNWMNGPPVPAPLQLVGLGLVGLAAERLQKAAS
jgi:hypothetical protein